MPRTLLALAALAAALVAGAAFTLAPAETPAGGPDDEAAARAFAQEWVAAWNAHDGAAFADLYADGAIVVWPDGNGAVVTDRAAFAQGSAAYHASVAAARLDVSPAHVRLLGAGAAVVTLDGTADFGETAFATNLMLVLERAGDGWRIAAEHDLAVTGR